MKYKNNNNNNIYVGSEGMGSYGKRLINYLLTLKYPNKNIVWENTNKSNIIVASNFYKQEQRWNNDNNKQYIYWSGESYNYNDDKKYNKNSITIISSTKQNNDPDNVYYIPYCCLHFNYKQPVRNYNVDLSNRKLLAYCNSNPVEIREILVSLIAEKDNTNGVYALGKAVGRSSKINKKKLDGEHSDDNMIKEYSNYKFVIAMENKIDDGYITEKIINAFRSGAVPIFWGDSKAAKQLFNDKAFICVNDFKDLDECANYIVNLDDNKIRDMINEPVFKDNKMPEMFRIDDYDNPPEIYKQIAQNIS